MTREGSMPLDLQHRLAGERTLMRIYVGEGDRYDGEPLFRAIVNLLRQRGLAGATVMQCIMGFGATRSLHSYTSDVSALDLPVVVECVDSEAHIQSVLPALDEMIGAGLITLERAKVIAYRAQQAGQTPGEA
jgi:PII-like signaling protein